MYIIKSLEVLNLHPKLEEVLDWLFEQTGPLLITSAHRPDDVGVHGVIPVRGIDLRCRSDRIARNIADVINSAWIYDPERFSLQVCPDPRHGTATHLHIQVHFNTVRRV